MQERRRPIIGWGLGARPPPTPPIFSENGERIGGHFLDHFDALIAYSQRGADEYAAFGVPRRNLVAHNAVAPAPMALPDRRPWTDDHPTTLFVGRLQARKRIGSLLHACAEMPARRVWSSWGMGRTRKFGSVSEAGLPVRGVYRCNAWGRAKTLFCGSRPVRPARNRGVGSAGSHELRLTGHRGKGDGTQDDLVRAENGWQIPPGDDGALVATMREALSDVNCLRKMGMNYTESSRRRSTWRRWLRRL